MKVEITLSDRQVAIAKSAIRKSLKNAMLIPNNSVDRKMEAVFAACEKQVNTCDMATLGFSREEQSEVDRFAATIAIHVATKELKRIMGGN